ncbi:uncharacterized protein BYT42DRAFT_500025 [Radiomyces spectabilis]|uniref:uncharacterized protein n=1 Tax=Radiomyces spectabilis TaxID=64574 RepID=UPI00221FC054|nr:uncharacterized protein BYT42DRAFT_500025 [Radiomyces spectabilis]KAI8374135.1 hypothetical protein BYT42DRAFT_500025 [Radiomyces spectabilis]
MFLASRCKTFQEWFGALCGATLCFEENPDSVASGNVRLGGWIKFARALCKYCFMRYCVDPLLCSDPVDILALRPYDPYALFQTVLLGVKAYCVLGFTDAFMGLVQLTLNVPLIDFFDSPILAYSPRDFWR